MKKPKDLDVLEQCVKQDDFGKVKVFCVECDEWRYVALKCKATVVYYHYRTEIKNKGLFILICGTCCADVNYLFDPIMRDQAIRKLII